jgi:hypothetical protein
MIRGRKSQIIYIIIALTAATTAVAVGIRKCNSRCTSLARCIDRLSDDGILPKDATPQIPPVNISLLGSPMKDDGKTRRPYIESTCYVPRSPTQTMSISKAIIAYDTLQDFANEIVSPKSASIKGSDLRETNSVLELHETFVQTSVGVYDPASICEPGAREIVTWEWGAKRVILKSQSTDSNAIMAILRPAFSSSLKWNQMSVGVFEAHDVVLAFSTSRLVTTRSGPVSARLNDNTKYGTLLPLPPRTPEDLAISFEKVERRTKKIHLMVSGRDVQSDCGRGKKMSDRLYLGLGQMCTINLGPATLLIIKSTESVAMYKIDLTQYHTSVIGASSI